MSHAVHAFGHIFVIVKIIYYLDLYFAAWAMFSHCLGFSGVTLVGITNMFSQDGTAQLGEQKDILDRINAKRKLFSHGLLTPQPGGSNLERHAGSTRETRTSAFIMHTS